MNALFLLLALAADPIPSGSSRLDLDIDGTKLEVFVHKPENYLGEKMLVVMHGVNRNADEYRDHAVVLAQRFGMLVAAPKFDEARFPSRAYQRGGILKEDGTAADAKEWTYAYIPKVAAALREREAKPKMPFWVIGHSAGGQFCMRMAAFQDLGAERIVAANAGSCLFPEREPKFGYGFGGLPESLSSDEVMRRYLAAPLTLFLALEDNGPDEWLDTSEPAMKQGPGRLQRNRAAFAAAEKLAAEKKWPFAWRKVEVEGIGHDHEKMFAHPLVEEALFGSMTVEKPPVPR